MRDSPLNLADARNAACRISVLEHLAVWRERMLRSVSWRNRATRVPDAQISSAAIMIMAAPPPINLRANRRQRATGVLNGIRHDRAHRHLITTPSALA